MDYPVYRIMLTLAHYGNCESQTQARLTLQAEHKKHNTCRPCQFIPPLASDISPQYMSIVSNQLFSTHNIVVFRIPPGELSLSKWNTDKSNIVWKGSLRLTEQELIEDDDLDNIEPCQLLRLKLLLYNKDRSSPLLEEFIGSEKDSPWAEVWYNPFPEADIDYSIANDGEETIQMTPDSPRYYKIIAQLPGTGYHPFNTTDDSSKHTLLQVALGLRFEDSDAAISFADSLSVYRRRFRAHQEKFMYDKHLVSLQHRIMNRLSLADDDLKDIASTSDDDDFGTFVSSSYD